MEVEAAPTGVQVDDDVRHGEQAGRQVVGQHLRNGAGRIAGEAAVEVLPVQR